MSDINFNNMHQVIDEPEQLYFIYDNGDESFSFDFELDLDDDRAVIVHKPLICNKCNEIYPYAEPNGENNSFRCYSCRKYG